MSANRAAGESSAIDRIPSGTRDVLPDETREVRAITDTLRRVFEWADKHDVAPYLLIDRQLVLP